MVPARIRSHFFSAPWIYGAGALLLLGIVLQQRSLALLGGAVLLTFGANWAWTRYSLNGIKVHRTLSDTRCFRGERIHVRFEVENRSLLPLAWIRIEEQLSDRVRPVNTSLRPSDEVSASVIRHTTTLGFNQRVEWHVELDCQERGPHFVGPTTLSTGDPFGFFTTQMVTGERTRFLVYPEVVRLPQLEIPPDHPFGDNRVPYHLLTDPVRVIGVRQYAPDDPIRHIHWKASARLGDLQVKVFEPTVSAQFGIFLCLDTFERYWEGMDSIRVESAITAAASVASHSIENGATVGVYANGVIADSDQTLRIPPGRGDDQLERVLTGLARLSPLATTSFPPLLAHDARTLPLGSSVMVIACLVTSALEESIEILIKSGYAVSLIAIGEFPTPAIPGLAITRLPGQLNRSMHRRRYARLIDATPVTRA